MKFIISLTMLLMIVTTARADYIEDVRNLGYISGGAIACGAKKYKPYEMIARAYLVSSAKSDKEQEKGMYEYNTAKAEAYLQKRRDGLIGCEEINVQFNNQKIFQSKLYKNGRLKMPDGKIIIPRQAYDATLLYDKNTDEKERLDAYYEALIAKKKIQAQKQGIYEKIRKAEIQNSY